MANNRYNILEEHPTRTVSIGDASCEKGMRMTTTTATNGRGETAALRREPFRLETTINEFGRLIWSFTLYCAGRQTYAPSICERIITTNKEKLVLPWRSFIISEIEGRFAKTFLTRIAAEQEQKRAKEAGDPDWWEKGYKGGPLGADFDETGWMLAIQELEKATPAKELVIASWDGVDAPIVADFDDVDDFWFMVCGGLRNDFCGEASGAVMGPDEWTGFVRRHMGSLNGKWVTNILRDLAWDFYGSYEGNDDFDLKWQGLRELLESWDGD